MTEATENLLEVFERLLRRQQSPITATRQFRFWKHNDDILPRLEDQLDAVLVALKKFEPIVYDMQGILDDGTDMAIRYRTVNQGNEEREFIGFQVKSYSDLSKSDYMKDLKAQHDDSFRKVHGLRYYFILLCTDMKEHTDKIRNINSEFRNADRTKIINPRFAYTFLNSPITTAEAFVKRTMQSDDVVLGKALDSLDQTSQSAQALAIFLAVKGVLTGQRQFSESEVTGDTTLRRVYDKLRKKQTELIEVAQEKEDDQEAWKVVNVEDDDEDYADERTVRVAEFEPQVTEDLEMLEADLIERDGKSNGLVLLTDQLRALNAVIADALARYGYTEDELMAYMLSLMGVLD